MPGPVSDSFDPEFGTGANAGEIVDAINDVIDRVTDNLGQTRFDILAVVRDRRVGFNERETFALSERELRIIRFCLHRAKDSI
jgi:hypothetical protein